MEYIRVPMNGSYVIVDHDSDGLIRKVTPNLEDNELMMFFMEAKDCPINEVCVHTLDPGGVSEICNFLKYVDLRAKGRLNDISIACSHEKSKGNYKLSILRAECPEGPNKSCIDCEYLENINVPSHEGSVIKKSHAFIVCGTGRKSNSELPNPLPLLTNVNRFADSAEMVTVDRKCNGQRKQPRSTKNSP